MSVIDAESDVRGIDVSPIPHKKARADLYKLFMKIGATAELPEDPKNEESYLNDFWVTLYLRNNICPADIPFHIIIDEFTVALVQNVVDRKGNNQAAICAAFNEWIKRPDVRDHLYQIRDRLYPDGKPKQIEKDATPETVADYSDEELQQKLSSIRYMAGIKMVDKMIAELESEIERRKQ